LARLLEKRGEFEEALRHLWKVVALQAELERHTPTVERGALPR